SWTPWSRSTSSSTTGILKKTWRCSARSAQCARTCRGSPTPDLQASLPLVSARKDADADPYRTVPQPSVGDSTSAGTRFRILRPHAKGGLGQVSVALDQELDRPVALKEIQDRHADEPHSRAGFVQEAEITGKLEHPGIIPVYGLGHYADGRP